MASTTILTVLVICALMLLAGGVLLGLAVVALWLFLRLGGSEDEVEAPVAAAPVRPVAASPAAPGPGPTPLQPMAPPPRSAPTKPAAPVGFDAAEDDGGKTEVFSRGSLGLDWDDEEGGDGATEIFRADRDLGDEFKLD